MNPENFENMLSLSVELKLKGLQQERAAESQQPSEAEKQEDTNSLKSSYSDDS